MQHKMTTPAAVCVVAEGLTNSSGISVPSVMWDQIAGGQLIAKYAQHAVPSTEDTPSHIR